MTTNFQNEKNLIRDYYKALDSAKVMILQKFYKTILVRIIFGEGFTLLMNNLMQKNYLKSSGSHFAMPLKICKEEWIFL